ncbi:MAG: CaiB/BaiF CoA-transferase family protein [Chloroflexota bacterium]|mgnify:CR=1 FL=1
MMALDHVKVLDLSRRYPAGYGAMFLGDFGAQIIKVDPPPAPGDPNAARYAAFFAPDRNKRSVVLDLKRPAAQQVLHRLAKTADILIENNRPGVMKRLNCGYDTLKEINPRLIYCACSGFGQDGPYVELPAHDMNYIGIAGALSLVGPRDGPPCFPSNYVADMAGCGLHAAIGMLVALAAREKTGRGQFVDISYTDGVMSVMMSEVTGYLYTGTVPKRGESRTTGGRVWAQVYKCKDGEYYTIACAEKHLWDNFCRAIGRGDLIEKHQASGEEKDGIVAELSRLFATRTRQEWWQFFWDKNVCSGPVNYVDEAFRDPQLLHRDMLLEFDHPTVGKVRQLGMPIKLSDTPGTVRTLGVPTGTHTEEVLAELGYAKKDIAALRGQGALG